jgi:uracil-DNA glycosylase
MSLDLDRRQRAMLQEMGVRVWWPEAVPEPVTSAASAAVPAASRAATVRTPLPPPAQKTDPEQAATPAGDIAGMDWPTLAETIARCQSCQQGVGRRSPVFALAAAARQADWLLVGEPPDDNEERLGQPIAGQAAQLLDNMLKAVGARRGGLAGNTAPVSAGTAAAYVTNVVKCRPATARNPEPSDLAACEHYLRREVALVQPRVILALGRFAAQALLQGSVPEVAGIPLGRLRGQVYRYQDIPVIVSYHPAYLLRSPQEKARAWLDWCLALQLVAGHGK